MVESYSNSFQMTQYIALCLTQKVELFVGSHDQMSAYIRHGNVHFHKIGWKLVLFQIK